jgi:hypothetical protein
VYGNAMMLLKLISYFLPDVGILIRQGQANTKATTTATADPSTTLRCAQDDKLYIYKSKSCKKHNADPLTTLRCAQDDKLLKNYR